MPDSFSFDRPLDPPPTGEKTKVLVTGAGGNIGSYFAEHCADRYDLRLMLHRFDEDAERLRPFGEVVKGDVTDLRRMHEVCEDIDTVLHLAGNPSPSATWQSLRDINIEGTYHTMVAAKAAGCRRVIFASSIHAVSGYPPDRQVMAEDPVNPGDLYGVSKCFGEALGRYMAEQQGLSVIAVRICWFNAVEKARRPDSTGMLDAFVSRRDLTQLLRRCVDDQRLKFAIVHGLSDNHFKRLDLTETRELLGYEPQDDLTDLNPRLAELQLGHTVRQHDEVGDGSESGIREEIRALEDGPG
jgi:nucleoside-diphosphate-sugar epimerase